MNKLLKEAFQQKAEHRRVLARLPFEQKINILGSLQKRYMETKSKVDFTSLHAVQAQKKRDQK